MYTLSIRLPGIHSSTLGNCGYGQRETLWDGDVRAKEGWEERVQPWLGRTASLLLLFLGHGLAGKHTDSQHMGPKRPSGRNCALDSRTLAQESAGYSHRCSTCSHHACMLALIVFHANRAHYLAPTPTLAAADGFRTYFNGS